MAADKCAVCKRRAPDMGYYLLRICHECFSRKSPQELAEMITRAREQEEKST